jgi:20S proteasome subunit alpha 7
VKDKEFELEMSWICPESNNQHQLVPKEILAEADKQAKAALEADMEDTE